MRGLRQFLGPAGCYTAALAVIDLDHNATTPLAAEVRDAMVELLGRSDLGNPSSVHRGGQAARDVVEQARAAVAAAVGAEPLGVTWTSGGTEADALAILGTARARRAAGRPDGVLSSPVEHPAVLGALQRLRVEGHAVELCPVDAAGRVAPGEVARQLAARPALGLVSLSAANHELGNALDVPATVAAIREVAEHVDIHVDAVQALGKLEVDFAAWGVDLVSLSAHKVGGPMGIGALVHRRAARLEPLWGGGAQERGRRPGSEPLLLAHGFGVAAAWASRERERHQRALRALHARLRDGLQALGGRLHGDPERHTGNTVNVGFAGCDGQLVAMALDLQGIRVSTGAACSAGTPEPSAVLLALGQPQKLAREAVRISLSPANQPADVDALLAALPAILFRVRAAGARVRAAGDA